MHVDKNGKEIKENMKIKVNDFEYITGYIEGIDGLVAYEEGNSQAGFIVSNINTNLIEIIGGE